MLRGRRWRQIDTVRAYTYTAGRYFVEIDIILAPDMCLQVRARKCLSGSGCAGMEWYHTH